MQKNVPGQRIGVQMVSASDGSAFTGTVTVYLTGDAGTQAIGSVSSGICTHEGNGYHSYAPAQSETNYDLIAFTFIGSGAVPVTVQVYTAINPVTAVPTAAANATAVRSELTTELGRIDAATSTRLASASYTAPDNASIASILSGVNTLLGRIPSTLFSGITYLSRWLGAIAGKTADTTTRAEINATPAGVTFNETTDSGEAIRDRGDAAWITGSSGAGSGARTVTVTVNDGSSALQNATVRMTEGSNTYIASTNASGVATFNLDDATYTVAITKSGYSYAGTTLVVDGNETVTYSMTATSITPSNPSLVTGYYTCYSELGVVESGVTVTLQVDRVPSETGLALDSAVRTATSDSNGLAQFTNLVPGAWYKVRRGEGNYYTFQLSATATGSVELNSIIGT